MATKSISFIGLGVMGYPMAGHLATKGYPITVYNRSPAKSEAWTKEFSGSVATSAEEAGENADIVFICVGNDDDVRKVVLGEAGLLRSLKPGSLVVDHTTASARLEKELADLCLSRGIGFMDAPVSGGGLGAKNGTLSIMVGGRAEDFERAQECLETYGRSITHLGPVGSGQLTKMVNQICIAGTLQGVAEAIRFGLNADLDMNRVLSVISKGAAQSWQLENRGNWMLEGRSEGGFAVDLMTKDLDLCLKAASRNGSPLPVANLVHGFFTDLQRRGLGSRDFSSLFLLLDQPPDDQSS